ncbi:MAG: right-handed parallel beta-helix repeat-containing protein [Myxococcota bacterium]
MGANPLTFCVIVLISMCFAGCGDLRGTFATNAATDSSISSTNQCVPPDVCAGVIARDDCDPSQESLTCSPGDEAIIRCALQRGGKRVNLSPGVYYIVEAWTLESDTVLSGDPAWVQQTILRKASCSNESILVAGKLPHVVEGDCTAKYLPADAEADDLALCSAFESNARGVRDIQIRSLRLEGEPSNLNCMHRSFSAVHLKNATGVLLSGLRLFDIGGSGIRIEGSRRCGVKPFARLSANQSGSLKCDQIELDDVGIRNAGRHGVDFASFCSDLDVHDSDIRDTYRSGINCARCSSENQTSTIRDNFIKIESDPTSLASPCRYPAQNAEVLHLTNYGGIRLSNLTSGVHVYGNHVRNYSRAAWTLSGSHSNFFYDNILRAADRATEYERFPICSESEWSKTCVGDRVPEYCEQRYSSGPTRASEGLAFDHGLYNVAFCNDIAGADTVPMRSQGPGHDLIASSRLGYPIVTHHNLFAHNFVHHFGDAFDAYDADVGPPLVELNRVWIVDPASGVKPVEQRVTATHSLNNTASTSTWNVYSATGGWCSRSFTWRRDELFRLRPVAAPQPTKVGLEPGGFVDIAWDDSMLLSLVEVQVDSFSSSFARSDAFTATRNPARIQFSEQPRWIRYRGFVPSLGR